MMTGQDAARQAFRLRGPVTVAIVIVTYNSSEDLPGLIASLRPEAAQIPMRVVVVDNSSTDGSLELAREHSDVVAVASGGNLGYAAGLNVGMAYVGPAEAVLVLNPDLRVEPGAVRTLLDTMRSDSRIGIVAPRILDAEGRTTHSLRHAPGLLRAAADALLGKHWPTRPPALTEHVRDDRAYAAAHEADWATGAGLLVSSRAAEEIGPWDETFFLYSEETDYFARAQRAGWKTIYEPAAQVTHRQGGSGVSDELVALTLVNRVRYMDKHRPRAAELYRAIVITGELLRRRDPTHARARWALPHRSRWRHLPQATFDPIPLAELPAASVVIPAHNEEVLIGSTLSPLASLAAGGTWEVIVVCNGCTDRTADVARSFDGVTVIEIDTASKPAALNAGDAAARRWPRIYLDADIVTTSTALSDVVCALGTGGLLAARPAAAVDTARAGPLVRSYYRARGKLPSLPRALWGAGVYALSEAGHARLGRFPVATADDLHIDRLFDTTEKAVIDTTPVVVQAPRTAAALLQVATRARRGSAEQGTDTGRSTGRELCGSVRGPLSAVDAIVYAGVALAARRRAARATTRTAVAWERDETTRAPESKLVHAPTRPAASIDHVICTRFNLPTSIGPESVIRAKNDWLGDRVALFERYTVPSMQAQTNQDFTWIIYLDPKSPDWLLKRLRPLVDDGLLTTLFRESVSWQDLSADARGVSGAAREVVLTTNLDNDDGVASDFVDRLQDLARRHPRAALYLSNGLIVNGDAVYLRQDAGNAFCSVAEPWDDPQTAWRDVHNRLHRHFPTVTEGGPPAWLQVIHGNNVSNRVRGRRVSPEPFRSLFPGLLDQVPGCDRGALLQDRLIGAPTRATREGIRATGKHVIERVAGKQGLHHINAMVERARHTVRRS